MNFFATIFTVLFSFLIIIADAQQSKEETRTLFQPGIISTQAVEFSLVFSPSGHELFIVRSEDPWGTRGMKSSIYHALYKNGG